MEWTPSKRDFPNANTFWVKWEKGNALQLKRDRNLTFILTLSCYLIKLECNNFKCAKFSKIARWTNEFGLRTCINDLFKLSYELEKKTMKVELDVCDIKTLTVNYIKICINRTKLVKKPLDWTHWNIKAATFNSSCNHSYMTSSGSWCRCYKQIQLISEIFSTILHAASMGEISCTLLLKSIYSCVCLPVQTYK